MEREHSGASRLLVVAALAGVGIAAPAVAQEAAEASAQETETQAPIEITVGLEGDEIVIVTGTNIRGLDMGSLLPISVVGADEIELFGVDSGDELLDMLPEQGQNFFNEADNISGGVNSARGDVGAYNLRNVGTGNTLVLLNGRRMVNAAGFQTEEVGGSFVPVNSANSNVVPTFGLDRLEILKDGASAIYGADAVAGVVNNVLETDFQGLRLRARYGLYEYLEREPAHVDAAWGKSFNGDRTNLSIHGTFFSRNRVNAQEDPRWAESDFRYRVDEGSPWEGNTNFRNNSANSLYGQFDLVTSASGVGLQGMYTDRAGEFEVFPAGDSRCQWALNEHVCGAADGQGTERYNLNADRDISGKLTRYTVLGYLSHVLDTAGNPIEAFTEVMYYDSDNNTRRHPSAPFSTVKLRVAPQNYYNPFGPVGSPNRLPDLPEGVPDEGLEIEIDNYRFAEVPRIVDVAGSSYRLLQGLRGGGEWFWEGAVLYAKAERSDVTSNRVSNNLMVEALADPTAAAYNPFSGGVDSNLARALVDVRRDNETSLFLADFKTSNDELFALPAGPVGLVAGFEYRREAFKDDRDPRLDGTIVFTDFQGDTFPFVSDVVNSSPTPDNSGSRNVTSVFMELQAPLFENFDVQVAARYENFSDVGNTVVGKVAAGWRPVEKILVRGSWSQPFRVPNLVTVNETIVARQNTRTDWACQYAAENGGDPDQDVIDCRYSMQRTAQGSMDLVPEESDNYSFGIVVEPREDFTIAFDYWSIEKSETIGLFGEENHTVLDLLYRLRHGNANCGSVATNPAVVRLSEVDEEIAAIYTAAGLCPAGEVQQINDRYQNLDVRNVQGFDVAIRYRLETDFGRFRFNYSASFLNELSQEAGGTAAELVDAQRDGTIPAGTPVRGFDDLVQNDGNQKQKHRLALSWRKDAFGIGLTGSKIGKVYHERLTLNDGSLWWLSPMTTWNMTFDRYVSGFGDGDLRLRFGIRNMTDERAPLADRYFGYLSDVHSDYGRNYYFDVRLTMD